ncbi:hypothetical protein [Halomonas maura]|uniref:hypothetical protein n=1 Tax=Halomonas maura TaxID=117606 RepID=UPI0025B304ED|nr:hypothetical protein [Halomonas maura]MDN3558025.1 hypothetical protein [Halomonas maura]
MSDIVDQRIDVSPGVEAASEARFRGRAGESDRQPGLKARRVLRPQGNRVP